MNKLTLWKTLELGSHMDTLTVTMSSPKILGSPNSSPHCGTLDPIYPSRRPPNYMNSNYRAANSLDFENTTTQIGGLHNPRRSLKHASIYCDWPERQLASMRRQRLELRHGRGDVLCILAGLLSLWIVLSVKLFPSLLWWVNFSMEHAHSQVGDSLYLRCFRCSKAIRGPNDACIRATSMVDEDIGITTEHMHPAHGLCCRQDRARSTQNSEERHGHTNLEMKSRLLELEGQVRLIRNENLDFKKVLICLYSLTKTTNIEVKHQNSMVAEKVEHLEETLGLRYPHKKCNSGVDNSELDSMCRKMEKLKKIMAQARNFVDLSHDRNGIVGSSGSILNTDNP